MSILTQSKLITRYVSVITAILLTVGLILFIYYAPEIYNLRENAILSSDPNEPLHLIYQQKPNIGPVDAPFNFYNLGCKAAFSEELFPFTKFDTVGKYKKGAIPFCTYYNFDEWGFGGNVGEVNCKLEGFNGISTCATGIDDTTCTSSIEPPSPNIPWSDEQCGICATASQDPSCRWTKFKNDCYDPLFGDKYVETYKGMDISECYYRPKGVLNDHKLCCKPTSS